MQYHISIERQLLNPRIHHSTGIISRIVSCRQLYWLARSLKLLIVCGYHSIQGSLVRSSSSEGWSSEKSLFSHYTR